MIKRTIKVNYYRQLDTGEMGVDYDDLVHLDLDDPWNIGEYCRTFHIFKNNGKVSKTDCSQNDFYKSSLKWNQNAKKIWLGH